MACMPIKYIFMDVKQFSNLTTNQQVHYDQSDSCDGFYLTNFPHSQIWFSLLWIIGVLFKLTDNAVQVKHPYPRNSWINLSWSLPNVHIKWWGSKKKLRETIIHLLSVVSNYKNVSFVFFLLIKWFMLGHDRPITRTAIVVYHDWNCYNYCAVNGFPCLA